MGLNEIIENTKVCEKCICACKEEGRNYPCIYYIPHYLYGAFNKVLADETALKEWLLPIEDEAWSSL